MDSRLLILASVLVVVVAGCSRGATAPAPGTTHSAAVGPPISTPTLAQQVRRAMHAGPGFLDYCPTHSGVNPARFELDVPGGAIVPGWCATIAVRRATHDLVTFGAHWNGQKVIRKSGTWHVTYAVTRAITLTSTPVPRLIAQGGTSPP